jgi:hypothetical protein
MIRVLPIDQIPRRIGLKEEWAGLFRSPDDFPGFLVGLTLCPPRELINAAEQRQNRRGLEEELSKGKEKYF